MPATYYMKLIIGLGNPGKEYTNTRHNVGWLVVDRLAEKLDATWKSKKSWQAEIAETRVGDKKNVLVKPQTFMNRSGDAVVRARGFWHKVPVDNIFVIHDDVDLKLGDIRIKQGGGSAGHRGVDSVVQRLKNSNFHRIRIGIDRPEHKDFPIDKWVLGQFSEEEKNKLDPVIQETTEQILRVLQEASS